MTERTDVLEEAREAHLQAVLEDAELAERLVELEFFHRAVYMLWLIQPQRIH